MPIATVMTRCSRRSRRAWAWRWRTPALRRDEGLLTETDERAAELAIINEVQRGLPSASTCRRCTTSWATSSVSIFDARVVDIGVVDRDVRIRFWYTTERGVRSPDEPMASRAHGHARWRHASRP